MVLNSSVWLWSKYWNKGRLKLIPDRYLTTFPFTESHQGHNKPAWPGEKNQDTSARWHISQLRHEFMGIGHLSFTSFVSHTLKQVLSKSKVAVIRDWKTQTPCYIFFLRKEGNNNLPVHKALQTTKLLLCNDSVFPPKPNNFFSAVWERGSENLTEGRNESKRHMTEF